MFLMSCMFFFHLINFPFFLLRHVVKRGCATFRFHVDVLQKVMVRLTGFLIDVLVVTYASFRLINIPFSLFEEFVC